MRGGACFHPAIGPAIFRHAEEKRSYHLFLIPGFLEIILKFLRPIVIGIGGGLVVFADGAIIFCLCGLIIGIDDDYCRRLGREIHWLIWNKRFPVESRTNRTHGLIIR